MCNLYQFTPTGKCLKILIKFGTGTRWHLSVGGVGDHSLTNWKLWLIFIARYYAKRGLSCRHLDICPSVGPSVTRRYCVETAKCIVKLFHPRIATLFQIFYAKRHDNIPTDAPLMGRRIQGYEKNRDFRPLSRFMSEMIQDTAMVTMECE